jgi:hypothetical protein
VECAFLSLGILVRALLADFIDDVSRDSDCVHAASAARIS